MGLQLALALSVVLGATNPAAVGLVRNVLPVVHPAATLASFAPGVRQEVLAGLVRGTRCLGSAIRSCRSWGCFEVTLKLFHLQWSLWVRSQRSSLQQGQGLSFGKEALAERPKCSL